MRTQVIGKSVFFVALVGVLGTWLACDDQKKISPTPARSGSIVISGDTGQWLVPCGCASNQSGGLLRRATYLNSRRGSGDVFYVDVGGAAAGTTEYFREKFLAVLRGEKLMGLVAHNLGRAELQVGAAELKHVAQVTGVSFISANVCSKADGKRLFDPSKLLTVGPQRVLIVGVISPSFATSELKVEDPRREIESVAKGNVGSFDSLVVLAYMPDEELQQLATALPEADAVIGGPTGQAQAPRKVGRALVGSATNKGKFMIRLDAPQTAGSAWTGEVVEMGPTLVDEPAQTKNVQAYLARLTELDLRADETGLVPPLVNAPADYKFAGSAACLECHKDDHAKWASTHHSHASKALANKGGFDADAYCLQCHTTGFAMPGGFVSPKRTPILMAVGCESCHGPSQAHVHEPTVRTPFTAIDQCIRCHDRENSPSFDQPKYWAKIHHGKKVAGETK